MRYCYIILVQGFCPLNIKITQFLVRFAFPPFSFSQKLAISSSSSYERHFMLFTHE